MFFVENKDVFFFNEKNREKMKKQKQNAQFSGKYTVYNMKKRFVNGKEI